MKEYIRRYFMLRRHNMKVAIKKAKMSKMCYAFLVPYAIIFALFYILPVITSIFYSFTYYNILESPKFVGLQNYINLILQDDVFLIGVKNTFVIAVITGPLGYIASFLFAWLINEFHVICMDFHFFLQNACLRVLLHSLQRCVIRRAVLHYCKQFSVLLCDSHKTVTSL